MNDLTGLTIGHCYEAYGCRVNALSTEELFARYRKAGFLYPAKLERLAPHWKEVSGNWRAAARAGEALLYWITYDGPNGEWASIACWRSTRTGWQSQHLVSLGSPQGSRAVMLSGQAVRIRDGLDTSYQNWFRPDNRLPARVFGGAAQELAPAAALDTFTLLACPRSRASASNHVTVEAPVGADERAALRTLAREERSEAFMRAEELDGENLELQAVDAYYQLVGLRRYRRVWLAWLPGRDRPVGAAIAWRGPLGLNFSFLENRCDLLVAQDLSDGEAGAVADALLARAGEAYRDFSPDSFPVVTDNRTGAILATRGVRLVRQYCQSIWLRDSFAGWYRYVEGVYARIHRASHRRGFGTPAQAARA